MQPRKRDILLIDGFIRLIAVNITQIIPHSMNMICFNYYFQPFVFNPEAFHYDNIIFIDDNTIQTTQQSGYTCIDYIVDSKFHKTFDFYFIIKNLNGLITVGFFGVTEDDKPANNQTVNNYHHISSEGGAMMAMWSGKDHIPLAIDTAFKPTKRLTDKYRLKLPNSLKISYGETWKEIKIGIRFNMIEKTMSIYHDSKCLGTAFENIPHRIIPVIGMYGSFRKTNESSVSIIAQNINDSS